MSNLPDAPASGLRPAVEVLRTARTVESYRIESKLGDEPAQGIVGYPIRARGPQLDESTASRLTDLLLDPRGYYGDLWCGPIEPGVAFRFVGDRHTFTVLICFKCQEWAFWLDGERLGQDAFLGLQPELLQLVQSVFPADQELRAIQPSESFGQIYQIDALRDESAPIVDERRQETLTTWQDRIAEAIQTPLGGAGADSNAHSQRVTADRAGIIVLSTEHGHAAVAAMKGLTPQVEPRGTR